MEERYLVGTRPIRSDAFCFLTSGSGLDSGDRLLVEERVCVKREALWTDCRSTVMYHAFLPLSFVVFLGRDRSSVEERMRVRERDLVEILQRLENEVLRLREEARKEREMRLEYEQKSDVVTVHTSSLRTRVTSIFL